MLRNAVYWDSTYASLVEMRVRLLMYSAKLLCGYRTERPIFVYCGPSPRKRAFANQLMETPSRFAASGARSRGSSGCALV